MRGQFELPGVTLIPQTFPVRMAAETLEPIWAMSDAGEWRNRQAESSLAPAFAARIRTPKSSNSSDPPQENEASGARS